MTDVRPIDANVVICPYCRNKMELRVECSICRLPSDHPDYWPCAPDFNYRACFVCRACSQRTSNTFHSPVEHAETEEKALAKAVATVSSYAPVRHAHIVWKERFRGGFEHNVTIVDDMGIVHIGTRDTRHHEKTPYCSNCGRELGESSLNFCPNCGAKMEAQGDAL